MGESYPTLTPAEVCEILRELGFYHPSDHRKGSHQKWVNSLSGERDGGRSDEIAE